ncbi:MAG: hypothetical protein MRJ96_07930 [Nitrospirales bacterium]|nr:hypothetical protein [Nitrospira sp.]MDR4501362.1 hypothetical protein [Nitrospirales bacterium]
MTGLHFEKRREGDYYKLILHIGDCYVPVSDNDVETLQGHATATADRFLSILLEKVGYSTYLKEQIQSQLEQGGNVSAQISALQQTLSSP